MPASKEFKTVYAVSIAFQLGFLIAAVMIGFIFFGIIADHYFGTSPLFLIVGCIVGFIATLFAQSSLKQIPFVFPVPKEHLLSWIIMRRFILSFQRGAFAYTRHAGR